MNPTGIEWATHTWNPVTGCTPISSGCKYCYAKVLVEQRLQHIEKSGYSDTGFNVTLRENRLNEPYKVKKPAIIFIASMSDLFHKNVPDTFIVKVVDVIRQLTQHTFIILTKRPNRMRDFFSHYGTPYNLWLGVTVEDTDNLWRVHVLRKTPAALRFLSIEPCLEDVSIDLSLQDIDWVIIGGEKGKNARKCDINWFLNMQQRCLELKIPLFIKQLGGNCTETNKSLLLCKQIPKQHKQNNLF